jgi:hypothetical protein
MTQELYRYIFNATVPLADIEASLLLAILATESLHGEAQVRLDAAHFFEADRRACVIDASTPVGRDLNRLFAGFTAPTEHQLVLICVQFLQDFVWHEALDQLFVVYLPLGTSFRIENGLPETIGFQINCRHLKVPRDFGQTFGLSRCCVPKYLTQLIPE